MFGPIHVCIYIYIHIHIHIYIYIYMYKYKCVYIWCSVARPPPPLPPPWLPPLTGPIMLPSPRPPVVWVGWCGCLRGLFNPRSSLCGVVVGFGFNPPPPPLPPCNVVWCGGGLWVSGLVVTPFPPPCGVVVGVGFRVCTPAPPVVWVVGFRVQVHRYERV